MYTVRSKLADAWEDERGFTLPQLMVTMVMMPRRPIKDESGLVLALTIIMIVLMVLMGIGVRYVYRTSFLTAVVTVLVGFVPISVALIWLRIMTAGLVSG